MTKPKTRTLVIGLCVVLALVSLALFSTGASSWSTVVYKGKKDAQDKKQDAAKGRSELKARYPAVDYNTPESSNQNEKAKRQKRNKRFDKMGMVMSDPQGASSTTTLDFEIDIPAIPVELSDVILTADVLNSAAHLSNDKSGVYSEFTVQVDSVIKGLVPTNLISVSRLGGTVRYPSGRTELYEVSKENMPALGKRYVFFLKSTEDNQAYLLVTGYEIRQDHILPLDNGADFQKYRSTPLSSFLNTVRDVLAKN